MIPFAPGFFRPATIINFQGSGLLAGALLGNGSTAAENAWAISRMAGPAAWYSNPPVGYHYQYVAAGGTPTATSIGSFTVPVFSIGHTYFITAYNPQNIGDYAIARIRFLTSSDVEIVRLEMFNSAAYTTKIRYSTDGGGSWTTTGTAGGLYPLPRGELTFTADKLIFTAKGGNYYAQGYCTDFEITGLAMSSCAKVIIDNVQAYAASTFLYPKVWVMVGFGTGLDVLTQ